MKLHFDIGTLQTAQANLADPEVARTLDTMHDAHSVFVYEHHGMDCRVRQLPCISPTLSARNTASPGVSGNNPIILHLPHGAFRHA